ncbi:MAG: hypothetical protein ACRDGV_10055 [Candidatus Limnocylindria bacterium]
MTGATGDLTPEEGEAFVPAETREIADPRRERDVTATRGRNAPAQRGEIGDPERLPLGDPTNMATRSAGYGSEHGLAPDDPAYRIERHPSGSESERAEEPPPERSISGGDERQDHEERF